MYGVQSAESSCKCATWAGTAVAKNAPLAVTQQVVDIVHKVILAILVQMDVPCGAHVQPGTYECTCAGTGHSLLVSRPFLLTQSWLCLRCAPTCAACRMRCAQEVCFVAASADMAEHTTEHIRLLAMAEMMYLFEERLITMFHTQGPGKMAQAEAEAAADAMMAELLALEDMDSGGGKKGKKGKGGGGGGKKKKKGKKVHTGGGARAGGGGGGGGNVQDDKYLRGVANAMAADRRARKVVDASGIGGGDAGRSVLTELCTQLKGRLTQQMTGKVRHGRRPWDFGSAEAS
eukprot:SAG11_NODE_279_length_11283_cov_11.461820_2_plen_289_part_00